MTVWAFPVKGAKLIDAPHDEGPLPRFPLFPKLVLICRVIVLRV